MNSNRNKLWLAGAALGLLLAGSAQASLVPVNTGTTALGSVDPNWVLASVNPNDLGTSSSAYVIENHPAWVANDSVSKWISYETPRDDGGDSGHTFEYRLDFTTTSAGSAKIRWTSDNESSVYLDGNLVGSLLGNQFGSFSGYQTISWGANPLGHSITASVYNSPQSSGNPTGFRFEVIDVVVPEPSTYIAGGLAMLPLLLGLRSRWAKKA